MTLSSMKITNYYNFWLDRGGREHSRAVATPAPVVEQLRIAFCAREPLDDSVCQEEAVEASIEPLSSETIGLCY